MIAGEVVYFGLVTVPEVGDPLPSQVAAEAGFRPAPVALDQLSGRGDRRVGTFPDSHDSGEACPELAHLGYPAIATQVMAMISTQMA